MSTANADLATLSQARRAWDALNHPVLFEAAAEICPVRHGSAGWADKWASEASVELTKLAAAREAKARVDRFIDLSRDHVPQGLIEELEARVSEIDAGRPADDWRRIGCAERLCQFDRDAALAAAHAANGLGLLRVQMAKAALMAHYGGPYQGTNPLLAQWRKLHREQEALRHERPPEGTIRAHAARWIADPTEQNRINLSLFVA